MMDVTYGELRWTPQSWRAKYGDMRGFPWNEPNQKMHDDDGCRTDPCGRCEPATIDHATVGSVISGNPACDFPACLTRNERCSWGPDLCGDLAKSIYSRRPCDDCGYYFCICNEQDIPTEYPE